MHAHELLLLQVQLNQALSSPELSTSDQLDATLSTMGDMCEHLGEQLTYIAVCVLLLGDIVLLLSGLHDYCLQGHSAMSR